MCATMALPQEEVSERKNRRGERHGMKALGQLELFPSAMEWLTLPTGYVPCVPEGFRVERIILCRGSLDTREREAFVQRICSVFPSASIEEALSDSHNSLDLGETGLFRRHEKGKHTLVFGELGLRSAVWVNMSKDDAYLYKWCFSVYGLCPYDCAYCYLPGTRTAQYSPSVKIYVNLVEILREIDRKASELHEQTPFYLGKLQDGLALDPLTAYSSILIPFFAKHKFARAIIQTKSATVDHLLPLDHRGRTILSWTLNPSEIAVRYEANAPPVADRIRAMRRCAEQGYPVYAILMPVVPEGNWEDLYTEFVRELLGQVPLRRLTLGGACVNHRVLTLLERRLGKSNAISRHLSQRFSYGDGRAYYAPHFCNSLYQRIVPIARELQPGLPVFLIRDKGLRKGGPPALSSIS